MKSGHQVVREAEGTITARVSLNPSAPDSICCNNNIDQNKAFNCGQQMALDKYIGYLAIKSCDLSSSHSGTGR